MVLQNLMELWLISSERTLDRNWAVLLLSLSSSRVLGELVLLGDSVTLSYDANHFMYSILFLQ